MAQSVAGLHAFVGRATELATLRAALEAAERGSGGVSLLRGEAGIGKSRTAREVVAAARQRGFAVGIGHCVEGDAAPAYEPWVRALEGSAAGEELEARRTAPGRAQGEGEEPDAERERHELFRRVEASLREDAAKRPRLLLIEDLHWADVDSLRLLQHLARRLEGCAWLALCTQRDEEPVDERRRRALVALARDASAVPLGPLDETEVATLVAHWSGRAPAPELVRAARQRSGGNPLFLCELIALVLTLEGRVTLEALEAVGVPAVLQQLLERRLEHLSQESVDLLARSAVLGDPFALSELATWLGSSPDALLAALEPAERLRLVESSDEAPDRFRFTHALVRDAVFARLSRAERAEAHRGVAEMLEASGRNRNESDLARLAEHHRRGLSSHSAERAVECAAAAASLAGQQGAPDQAVRHLLLALDSLQGVAAPAEARERRSCALLLALGEAHAQAGEREEARETYLAVARIAQKLSLPEELARAAIGMVGRHEDPRGVGAETLRWVDLARAELGSGPTPLRVGLLALAARVARGRGDPRGEALAREGLAVADRVGRPETWASAAHALHHALGGPDALAERLALSERMVATAQRGASRRMELHARQRRFTDLLQIGDAVAADQELVHIDALARDCDHPAFLWHALSLAAGCDIWRGRLESGERRTAEAFAQGRRAGMRNAGVLFAVQTFHLREQQGRLGELRPAMQEMVERNPQVRSLPLIVPLAAMQERDLLLARSTFEPLAARDFEDVPADGDWLAVMTSLARIASYVRDRARCERLLALLRPYQDWCVVLPDGQFWEGAVARHLALLEAVLGESDAARAHFHDGLAVHRRAGALPLVAHTLLELGTFETEAGDAAAARESLSEALARYRSLGVALFVQWAEQALAAVEAAPVAPDRAGAPPPGRFEREGAHWTLAFAGRRAVVEHRKGMSDLAALLAAPGREIHALDLMTPESVGGSAPAPDPGEAAAGTGPAALPGVDPAALGEYRARLAELRVERDEADARGDLAVQRAADAEIAWLERELRNAFGAERGASGEFAEKARKAIYNRIRAAIAAIAAVHPELGRHLQHSIRTGVVCTYRPESPEEWWITDGTAR